MYRLFAKTLFLIFLNFDFFTINSQINFSAKIFNFNDSTSIFDVNIVALPSQTNTISDKNGFFSIKVKNSDTALCFFNLQYEKRCYKLIDNLPDIIYLHTKTNIIEEIKVTTDNLKHIESITGGELILSHKYIKELPQILGETDILKILTFMPGVSSASEISSGLSVRGGNTDQNLILLDNALLFNPTHLFGFLSSFNGDIISEVKLIKSNIPAEYGNVLSSVLSVETDSKIADKPEISGSIGIIAPRLSIKLPFFNKKAQIILSARRTFIDKIINNTELKNKNILNGSNYYFYDLNGKINFKPSLNSYFELSAYSGFDDFIFNGSNNFTSQNKWGNKTVSIKYIYSFNENKNIKVIGTYSNYFNLFDVKQDIYGLKMKSEIYKGKMKFIYDTKINSQHNLKLGFELSRSSFLPNSNSINADDVKYETGNGDLFKTADYAFFFSDKYKLNQNLSISTGIRLSLFHNIGPFNRLIHNTTGEITDTIKYSKNEIINQFYGIEPRFGLRYMLNSSSSIKFSATRNIQYQHLIAMSSVALPVDVWMPATEMAKPQIGYQFTVGWFKNIKNKTYKLSIDTYYKFMNNVYEYSEDILQLYKNINYDEGFTVGNGYSYGIEFFIEKREGKFVGQLSYALSKTMRKIDELNEGEKFHSKFDRPHNLAILGKFNLTKKISISANFVFISGTRMTIPIGRYLIQKNIINIYSKKNAYQLPAYHRFDLGINFILNKTNKYESKLNISVYNVYSRKNPFYLYFNISGDITNYELSVEAEQVSLFPILPSISWSFKF